MAYAGYAVACRHAAAHSLHAELDALALHLARASGLLPPPLPAQPAVDRALSGGATTHSDSAPASRSPTKRPAASSAAAGAADATAGVAYHARLPARLAAAALCRLAREV